MPEEKATTTRRCPSCGGERALEPRRIRDEFDYDADGERIRVVAESVPVLVCRACNEVFYGPEGEQAHHRAICKALGLLTPEEIKSVRERLGKNQAEFALLTGIGVATLSRWERGRSMQTRALDNYLSLLPFPENLDRLRRRRRRPEESANNRFQCLQSTAELSRRAHQFSLTAARRAVGANGNGEQLAERAAVNAGTSDD
jgi:HTH-type transcriptional regulator/antitoxin MqsA